MKILIIEIDPSKSPASKACWNPTITNKEGNMHSEICPVCQGKGEIPNLEGTRFPMVCHGCNGRGWVEVRDSVYPPYVPVPIQPFPYPYVPDPYSPWTTPCADERPMWGTQLVQRHFPV